ARRLLGRLGAPAWHGGQDPYHAALRKKALRGLNRRLRNVISRLTCRSQQPEGRRAMAIEKCINEYGFGDVIFEEGSTGRELYVVLDGEVEIAKLNGGSKTVIVTL